MKTRLVALALAVCCSIPLAAAPSPGDDAPRGDRGSIIQKIVRAVKRVLSPLDDLTIPKP